MDFKKLSKFLSDQDKAFLEKYGERLQDLYEGTRKPTTEHEKLFVETFSKEKVFPYGDSENFWVRLLSINDLITRLEEAEILILSREDDIRKLERENKKMRNELMKKNEKLQSHIEQLESQLSASHKLLERYRSQDKN